MEALQPTSQPKDATTRSPMLPTSSSHTPTHLTHGSPSAIPTATLPPGSRLLRPAHPDSDFDPAPPEPMANPDPHFRSRGLRRGESGTPPPYPASPTPSPRQGRSRSLRRVQSYPSTPRLTNGEYAAFQSGLHASNYPAPPLFNPPAGPIQDDFYRPSIPRRPGPTQPAYGHRHFHSNSQAHINANIPMQHPPPIPRPPSVTRQRMMPHMSIPPHQFHGIPAYGNPMGPNVHVPPMNMYPMEPMPIQVPVAFYPPVMPPGNPAFMGPPPVGVFGGYDTNTYPVYSMPQEPLVPHPGSLHPPNGPHHHHHRPTAQMQSLPSRGSPDQLSSSGQSTVSSVHPVVELEEAHVMSGQTETPWATFTPGAQTHVASENNPFTTAPGPVSVAIPRSVVLAALPESRPLSVPLSLERYENRMERWMDMGDDEFTIGLT